MNRNTDGVDEVFIEVISARKKNFKIIYAEDQIYEEQAEKMFEKLIKLFRDES